MASDSAPFPDLPAAGGNAGADAATDAETETVPGGGGGGRGHPSSSASASSANPTARIDPSPEAGRDRIVYRWVGAGDPQPDGTVLYGQLEVSVGGPGAASGPGGRRSLIRAGDCALLCSGVVEEEALFGDYVAEREARARQVGRALGTGTGEEDGLYGAPDAVDREEDRLYGGGIFDGETMRRLDPFAARIERMWEEPPQQRGQERRVASAASGSASASGEANSAPDADRRSRMKVQARWFYKKEDIQGLTSHFVGVSRRHLLKTMGPRELILGDQADDNEISTILGKCRVVRRPPLVKAAEDGSLCGEPISASSGGESLPIGSYYCRYGLTLHPPARAGAAGTVVFSKYDGLDPGYDMGDDTGSSLLAAVDGGALSQAASRGDVTGNSAAAAVAVASDIDIADGAAVGAQTDASDEPTAKRQRTGIDTDSRADSSGRKGRERADAGGSTSELERSSSASSDTEVEDLLDAAVPPATEGSQLHGSIHVGPGHQAFVPPIDRKRATRCRGPTLVWSPGAVSEEEAEKYIERASVILKGFMKANGIDIVPSTSIDEFESGISKAALTDQEKARIGDGEEANPRKRKAAFRECDIDVLLDNFHRCNYNTEAALRFVEEAPDMYLTIWNRQLKELFNSGFRRYYGNLRMIGKGLGKYKNSKEVVDYFYRFKIPEQFCKYKDRKREQAKRILQAVERRRFRDAVAEDENSSVSGGRASGGGKKASKSLVAAGVSPSSIGQVEKRRRLARELLSTIQDTIGTENYLKFCMLLKTQQSPKASMPLLRDSAENLLGDYPDLLDRFVEFLPKRQIK